MCLKKPRRILGVFYIPRNNKEEWKMEVVENKRVLTTKNMVRISVLSVISVVLMFFQLSIFFAPPFLKLDISDICQL